MDLSKKSSHCLILIFPNFCELFLRLLIVYFTIRTAVMKYIANSNPGTPFLESSVVVSGVDSDVVSIVDVDSPEILLIFSKLGIELIGLRDPDS